MNWKKLLSMGFVIGSITTVATLALMRSPQSNAREVPVLLPETVQGARLAEGDRVPTPVPIPTVTPSPVPTATPAYDLPGLGAAPELTGITHWLNSSPLTLRELRGKVVLIDFWTYTCINCIRTLPYVTEWHKKYADEGLVIIGVHSPEFSYEHSTENVAEAIARFEIEYPVAQDNDFATWRAYHNRYWPAFYFIDAEGKLRYIKIGEGEYNKSEKIIQQLLAEANR